MLLLLILITRHSQQIERYYSEGLYPNICRVLHLVFNLLPFSAGDILYIAVIVSIGYVLIRLFRLVFRKKLMEAFTCLLGVVISLQAFILLFYLLWGLNYYRPSAGVLLRLTDTSYNTADLKAVTATLIDSANTCRARLTRNDLIQTNDVIYQTAVAAIYKLSASSVNFKTYSPNIKPSLLTPVINYISTSGYFNPFTGEAQINYGMPVFDRPLVACHEMSHQMGYGAEDEANFVGFIAGIQSPDRLLRYSSYKLAVGEFMHALFYRDSLAGKALKPRISLLVHNDFVTERKYWLSYQNPAEIISSFFYNDFLKVNNQPQGLDTYNRMVLLIMALHKSKGQILHFSI